MATVSRAAGEIDIPQNVQAPEESVTDLKRCSTAIKGCREIVSVMKKPQEKAMHPLHRHRRHCIALCGRRRCTLAIAGAGTGQNAARKILVLGDSLSAEYGLARGTGWVTLLEQRLAQQHPNASVVNASISGETTAGGRSRLPALLKQHQPQIVVIELGATTRCAACRCSRPKNLRLMLQVSRSGAKAAGGHADAPNYGASYGRDFAQIYTRVAQDTRTPAGAVPPQRRGRYSECRRAVPGRPHPPPCRSPAADAGQRLAHRGLLG
jgi:acyl-CoA thioesterase-1